MNVDKTIEMREQEANALIMELYKDHHVEYQPLFPWVFVRVLPKTQKIGSLWTPEKIQNKPQHEGVVLATWKPFTKEIGYEHKNGMKFTRLLQMRSALSVGDHVMFHHTSGHPIPSFDDKYYRGVMEVGWSNSSGGGIYGTVDRGDTDVAPHETLTRLLTDFLLSNDFDGEDIRETDIRLLASKIEARFHMIDNERSSVSLSGV